MRPVPVLVALATILPALAADPAAPPPPDLVRWRDMGPLETNPVISGRDGAYSGRMGTVSVWTYGDTVLTAPGEDGGTWRHNTLSWTHDLHAADGITGFADRADRTGGPIEFLPLTAEELAFNRAHEGQDCPEPPCDRSYVLWAGPPFWDRWNARGYFSYVKVYIEGSSYRGVGTGLAVGTPAGPVTRPVVRPGADDPTLLFGDGEPGFTSALYVDDATDTVYFFDCSGGDGWTKPIHLARAPLAGVLDRDAWRFWSADGTWRTDVSLAAIIFDGSDQMSVAWNAYLGRWIALYVDPLSTSVVARAAWRPEGPWSDEAHLFDTLPPMEGGWVYCGMTHREFARDDGRVETMTYVRDVAPFQAERHVIELEWAQHVETNDRDAVYDPLHGVGLVDPKNPQAICVGTDGDLWRQMAVSIPLRVPHAATITTAKLDLLSSGRNAGSVTTEIRAIDRDDTAPFVAGATTPFTDAYPLTAASAPWTPDALPPNTSLTTPELRALVQSVVDRPGWASGNHVGFVFPETRTGVNLRCFEDVLWSASHAARLRVGFYAHGTAVCLDARGGEDGLLVTREPAGGCADASGEPIEIVFGRAGALRTRGGAGDLGPVRCADANAPPGARVVRAVDPDQAPGDASFYVWRAAGAPDFGRARLGDGSTPARVPVGSAMCP